MKKTIDEVIKMAKRCFTYPNCVAGCPYSGEECREGCGRIMLDYLIEYRDREKTKWNVILDLYDESASPKEEGWYRIIDTEGNEMVDYFYGEPVTTRIGIG